MSTIALKNRVWRETMVPPNFLPKKKQLWVWLMLGVFLLEIIAFSLFIKYAIISDTSSYTLAANALAESVRPGVKPGLATEQFMNELQSAGLKPVLIKKTIDRDPFSVKGVLVSLDGDNIQVFEYPDHETALKEGEAFAQKRITSATSNRWVNTMHLYIRDKIIVFYMGRDKDILVALGNNKEFFLAKPSVAISKSSN